MKNFYILLITAVAIAGIVFAVQINKTMQITVEQTTTPLVSEEFLEIPTTAKDSPLGNPGAPVTIVMFGDFTDEKTEIYFNKITKLVQENPTKARFFWKDFPNKKLLFKTNDLPNRAAYCAGAQSKFWEYAKKIFDNNLEKEEALTKTADELKLNTVAWWRCVNLKETADAIKQNASIMENAGIKSVPAIFLNNRMLNIDESANLEDVLKQTIQTEEN
jgi:protein-disulfide isomerase